MCIPQMYQFNIDQNNKNLSEFIDMATEELQCVFAGQVEPIAGCV